MHQWNDLDEESKELITKAQQAFHKAYAPYSKFRVAASILLENNEIITGANQENASYPLCMCAERVVLSAKASLYVDQSIKKMAVVAKKESMAELAPATPCGACRQVLLEFELRQRRDIEIVMMVDKDKWIKMPSAKTLLPYSFDSSNLEM